MPCIRGKNPYNAAALQSDCGLCYFLKPERLKLEDGMVTIRLQRGGAKKRPFYRIVVADGRARREGAYIEQLGTYDPLQDKSNFNIDLAKADQWIGKGAQPSETVRSLMKKARQASA
jgi:small subunit ribosomal protein S16